MKNRAFQEVIRLVLPIFLAAAWLTAGIAVLDALWLAGDGQYMAWYFPLALGGVAALWLLLRSKWSAWASPKVFLIACVPMLVLLLSAQILIPYSPVAGAEAEGRVGDKIALSGELLTVDGRRVNLEDYRGKVVFLNFWATWCGPCRAEMPSMADLHTRLSDRGLAVLAVTDEDAETVQAFLEQEPYPFTVLLDPKGNLFHDLEVRALPTTYVIDSAGGIVIEHQGGYLWNSPKMLDEFRRLLSE